MNPQLDELYYFDILLEKKIDRFLPMFNKYPDIQKNSKIREDIQKAVDILKKDDRIVWFLSWYKLYILDTLRHSNFDNELEFFAKKIGQMIVKIEEELKYFGPARDLRKLDHYFSLHIPEIDNRVFKISDLPLSIAQQFEEIEKQYFEKFKGSIDQLETDEVVMNFPDGWVWVNVHSPTCSREERQAMQHCGNEYGHQKDGDEIFSLREPVVIAKRTKWIPHLTFVVNEGIIREAKGKQNAKPVAKYHQYIVPLLKSKLITSINCHGSYNPKNNFSLEDLPENIKQEILELKGDDFETDPGVEIAKKLKELQAHYDSILKHCSIYYDATGDDDDSFYVDGSVSFNLENLDFTEKWDLLGRNNWTARREFLRKINLAIGVEDLEMEDVRIYGNVRSQYGDAISQMEEIGEELVDYERKHYDKDFNDIVNLLIEEGLVRPNDYQIFLKDIENDFDYVDLDDWTTGTISIKFSAKMAEPFSKEIVKEKIESYFEKSRFLDKLLDQNVKIISKVDKNQTEFEFKESFSEGKIFDKIEVHFTERFTGDNNVIIYFYIENLAKYSGQDLAKVYKMLNFIDENYKTITSEIRQVVNGLFNSEEDLPETPVGFTDKAKFKDWYFKQLKSGLKREENS